MASDSLRRWPPESVPVGAPAFSERPTSARTRAASAAAAARGTPRKAAYSARCSTQLSVGHSTSCCGHTPRRRRTSTMRVPMSRPPTVVLPPLGGTRPDSMLSVVVLPAPLWPSSAVISPS